MCCSGGGGDFPSPEEMGAAQARYNRIDQYTPYGSLTFEGPDRNIAVQNLSPEAMALQESMMGLRMGALNQLMSRYGATPFDMTNPNAADIPGVLTGSGSDEQLDGKYPLNQVDKKGSLSLTDIGIDPVDLQPAPNGVNVLTPDGTELIPNNDGTYTPVDGQVGHGGGFGRYPIGGGDVAGISGGSQPIPGYTPDYAGGGPGYVTDDYRDIGLPYQLGIDKMGDITEDRKRVEDAMYKRAMGLLSPQFAEEEARFEETMANRGMPIGSEETELMYDRMQRNKSRTQSDVALGAILGGGQETRAQRGQTLQEALAQFGASSGARQQLFGEQAQEYNQLASILGLTPTQGASGDLGGFFGPGQVDMVGPYSMQAQLQMANQGFGGDILGGLLGLGGSLGGAYLGRAQ